MPARTNKMWSEPDPMAVVHDGMIRSGQTFPEAVVLAQLGTIAKWYCEGMPKSTMGALLNVSYPIIEARLEALRAAWASTRDDYNQRKDEELIKLDNLEAEAWQAWHRSCEDKTVTIIKMATPKRDKDSTDAPETPRPTEQTVRREQRDGNAIYLEMVFRCIDRRIKMLGMDAPVKIQSDVTLKALAKQIAEAEGLDETDVLREAERIFEETIRTRPIIDVKASE